MRTSREQAAASREKILDVAAKRFRERGLGGIGVAELMADAGFTHGGFYAHFESKDDLIREASSRALDQAIERWAKRLEEGTPAQALKKTVGSYLSEDRLAEPGSACALAVLGSEFSRQAPGVRSAITDRLRRMMDLMTAMVPGRTVAARRKKALATYSTLVGALVLARAVDDPKLAGEILDAAR